eukprot:1937451-Alexandrium_andersonii.AAC.1
MRPGAAQGRQGNAYPSQHQLSALVCSSPPHPAQSPSHPDFPLNFKSHSPRNTVIRFVRYHRPPNNHAKATCRFPRATRAGLAAHAASTLPA